MTEAGPSLPGWSEVSQPNKDDSSLPKSSRNPRGLLSYEVTQLIEGMYLLLQRLGAPESFFLHSFLSHGGERDYFAFLGYPQGFQSSKEGCKPVLQLYTCSARQNGSWLSWADL